MKQFVAVLRAIGILVAVWGGLALVAYVTGAYPLRESDRVDGTAPALDSPTPPTDAPGPETSPAPPTVAPSPEPAPPAAAAATTVPRFVACESTVTQPSLTAAHLVGDPRPEILLGCGNLVHVFALASPPPPSEAPPLPFRVMTLDLAAEVAGAPIHAAAPSAGDVDGDSLPDLLVGFWYGAEGGAARGGSLHLVRQNPTFAFDAPRRLAPISAVQVGTAALDARSGQEVIALHRGNTFARRPSELWVFEGGPAPARTAQLRTGIGGEAFTIADVDRDGRSDLVAVTGDEGRVDVFFGDGAGRFPRSNTLKLPGARAILATSLDDQAGLDVVVAGDEAISRLLAPTPDTLELTPLAPVSRATSLAATDVDGDGRRDLLALAEGKLVRLTPREDRTFDAGELPMLPADLSSLHAMSVTDLDADGRPDLLLLHRPAPDAAWELLIVFDLRTATARTLATNASPLPDAPLRLAIPLR